MNLFDLKDFNVTFSPQALLVKPFKAIWKADKSKHKSLAVKELSFIYFYCHIRSSYQYIKDKDERIAAIKRDIELPDNWKITSRIVDAIDYWDNHDKSMAKEIYKAAVQSVDVVTGILRDNVKDYIENSDDKFASLQKLVAIQEKLPKVMSELKKAEALLIKEENTDKGDDYNLFESNYESIMK